MSAASIQPCSAGCEPHARLTTTNVKHVPIFSSRRRPAESLTPEPWPVDTGQPIGNARHGSGQDHSTVSGFSRPVLDSYADLAIGIGLNLRPGQRLMIIGPLANGGVSLAGCAIGSGRGTSGLSRGR